MRNAEVAEQADAHDSNSCSFGSVGSIPTFGTYLKFAWIISWALPQSGRVLFVTLGEILGSEIHLLNTPGAAEG